MMNRVTSNRHEIFDRRMKIFLILYFIQGLPYGLQTRYLPIYLRSSGMSLTNLGYFRMLLAPWVLKGLWAPIIDRTGDLQAWLDSSHVILIILCILTSQFSPEYLLILSGLMFLLHLSVAVQDIALDGLLIELLTPAQLVTGNMIQVIGYKTGTIFSGGLFGFLSDILGWESLFFMIALMYAAGYLVGSCLPSYNIAAPPQPQEEHSLRREVSMAGFDDTNSVPIELSLEVDQQSRGLTSSIMRLFDVEGTAWLLCFAVVYKIGDQGISSLFPMFLIDVGIDVSKVAFWSGLAGQMFSLLGSLVGGYMRKTMIEALQILLVMQTACLFFLCTAVKFWIYESNLYYATTLVLLMTAFLTSGGVTTCTYTLIMQLSQRVPRRNRTSHYTLLATGEVAGRLTVAGLSGFLVDQTSYTFTFLLFTALSFMIIPFVMYPPRGVIITPE